MAKVSCNSSLTATAGTWSFSVQQNYTITVSASPSAGGTASGGGTFAAGSSRTVTATANNGYTFTTWTENGSVVSSSSSYTFTLNSNRILAANFMANSGAQPLQLLLEQFGPSSSQLAALDSILFLRDPFPVVNGANPLNLALDKNTRVIIFVANLQLAPGETSSSVLVNLIDNNNQSYEITAEDVRPLPNSTFTQVIFRLPNNPAVGTCTITIRAHDQISNSGTIRIRI